MEGLPDKLYYSIREVSQHVGIEPHVLRYWESEFPNLKPKRSRAGSRSDRKKDIEEIQLIRKLLHEEGYRIDGARKYLKDMRSHKPAETPQPPQMAIAFDQMDPAEKLKLIRNGLQDIQRLLSEMKQKDASGEGS